MPQWLRVHFRICVFVVLSPHHLTSLHHNFDLVSEPYDTTRMYLNNSVSLEWIIVDLPL